ncbi:MAG TPA: radical SAM protein [Pyrinomonadaceae bacterium]|nr:radical SAM protein [Pyrinomonadaceae bacterium]
MDDYRQEPWGQILYDRELDEFEAQVCDERVSPVIDRPLSAGCLVTGRCNLRCNFCYGNDESLPTEELSIDDWKNIFVRLRSWGLMRVDLSGGEPTLRTDIGDIARHALDVGLNVVLSTNGLVLHKTGPSILPKQTRIHVSLDSGFDSVHESSRVLRTLRPSQNSFRRTMGFIRKSLEQGYSVRVLTCIGQHNNEGLFQLGQLLATVGVKEWNISRILPAGRAKTNFEGSWAVNNQLLLEQISTIRYAFPWMRIRYSNRIDQDGYFLLVLPDGTLATQYTDERDKVGLGRLLDLSLDDLRSHPDFKLRRHGRKWIAACVGCQHSTHRVAA